MDNKELQITKIPGRVSSYLAIYDKEKNIVTPIARFLGEEQVQVFIDLVKSKGVYWEE